MRIDTHARHALVDMGIAGPKLVNALLELREADRPDLVKVEQLIMDARDALAGARERLDNIVEEGRGRVTEATVHPATYSRRAV